MDFSGKQCKELLSKNLTRYREQLGLSQFKLAAELGISAAFLSDIEAGKSWVSPATLEKIAAAFNIEVYELFMSVNEPPEIKAEVGKYLDTVDESLTLQITRSMRPFLERAIDRQMAWVEQTVTQAVEKVRRRHGKK
jgi:transcriptional regulator with XRE-family HTH domain